MKNILIVGASSGIGAELASAVMPEQQVFSASRASEVPTVHAHQEWDAASGEPFPANFLPNRLDGMAYCPGTIRLLPFERLTENAFREDFELNLMGAVRALNAALPSLRAAPLASVVLFSTVAVSTGMPMHASIAAAKGAVEGLTRALAAELAPGIRVNAIAPSLTDTPLAAKLLRTDRQREAVAGRHPLERVGDARDLSATARFLLSEESSWITGQILHVDGGLGTLRRLN